jgi:16S rRNA (guanine966-N2)-methyltransferase
VFLDPPYGRGLIAPAIDALGDAGWIAPGALIVAEMAIAEDLPAIHPLAIQEERRYGKAKIQFLQARI